MIGAWAVIALFAARMLQMAWTTRGMDGDLYWQRRLGEAILHGSVLPSRLDAHSFAAPGAAWVPQEWAFGVAVAWARDAPRWEILGVATVACAVAALAISAYRARRRGAEPFAIALTTGFAALALTLAFGVRAQDIAWLPFALLLFLIDLDGPWLWAALPLTALWSNLHASVVLAPLVVAVSAVGAVLDAGGAWTPLAKRRLLVAAGVLVALGCNPLGFHLLPYAAALQFGDFKSYISEWNPPFPQGVFALSAMQLLLIVLARGPGKRATWTDVLLFVGFAVAMLGAMRHVLLFVIVALPLAASALSTHARDERAPRARTAPLLLRLALPAVLVSLTVGGAIILERVRPIVSVVSHLPVSLVSVLADRPGEHRVLCGDFAWCSVMLDAPNAGVILDGRADPYPSHVWLDWARTAALRNDWQSPLQRYAIDTVVTMRGDPLDQALSRTPPWYEGGRQEHFRIWFRPQSATAVGRTPVPSIE